MVDESRIADIMNQEVNSVTSTEPIRMARRRMESEALRSLLVVDEGRPVGVIEWISVLESGRSDDRPVSELMLGDYPVLTTSMTVLEARAQLSDGDVNCDLLPVVDELGRVVGQVHRESIGRPNDDTLDELLAGKGPSGVAAGEDSVRTEASASAPSMKVGMTVVDQDDKRLGEIDQIMVDLNGQVTGFTIMHGFFSKKHKRVPADVIKRVEGDTVVIRIGPTELDWLADVEDEPSSGDLQQG